MADCVMHTEYMRAIQSVRPGIDPAAVVELITSSGSVYVIAWEENLPIIVRRHPAASARPLWIDRGFVEVEAVAPLRVGGRVEICVVAPGSEDGHRVRSELIVAIRVLDDE